VHADDLRNGNGAPVADVECIGTALRDFHRLTDGRNFTEEEIGLYDNADADGVRVFVPQ